MSTYIVTYAFRGHAGPHFAGPYPAEAVQAHVTDIAAYDGASDVRAIPMPLDGVAYLKGLQDSLWKHTPRTANSYGFSSETRRLTWDEWCIVQALMKSLKLGVEPYTACFGFGIGISLWDSGVTPGVPPDALIALTQEHLPLNYGDGRASGPRFEEAWPVFEPLFKGEENRARLAFMGRPEPKTKGHYEY